MGLSLLTLVSCVVAVLGQSHHHLYGGVDAYDNGGHGNHEFDEGGLSLHKHIHGSHGQSHHGGDVEHGDQGQSHHSHHDIGSDGSQVSQGGHEGHVKKYHDKGSYSREKKYGYEKAYGHEKEFKHHDKGGDAHSYGDSYNHHKHHAQHKKGAQGGQSHATHGKKHHYGGQSQGHHGHLLDQHHNHKLGKDNYGYYNHQQDSKLVDGNFANGGFGGIRKGLRRPIVGSGLGIGGRGIGKWRYIGGLHGLGGLRGYVLGSGYGGLRRGLGPYNGYGGLEGQLGSELESRLSSGLEDSLDGGLGVAEKTFAILEGSDIGLEDKSIGSDELVGYSVLGGGQPVGLSGLGGGLGPHGHYYFVKHNVN